MYCTEIFLVVVSLVAVSQLTNASVGFEQLEVSPEHPDKCFRSRDELIVGIGENKTLPGCLRATCRKEGEKMTLELAGCGTVAENKNCKKVEDRTKPYPACCPTLQCP